VVGRREPRGVEWVGARAAGAGRLRGGEVVPDESGCRPGAVQGPSPSPKRLLSAGTPELWLRFGGVGSGKEI
jgi:hypothetical protein